MKLLVATSNVGKLRELRAMLEGLAIELVTVKDVGIDGNVVEDAETFEGNARKKASTLALRAGSPALADDSGLEVDTLGGAPGVYSARYAGEGATDAENLAKLLVELGGSDARSARFRCVLAFSWPNGEVGFVTDGRCEGSIAHAASGSQGFGYDPVFVPEGESRTMAELDPAEKNAISHRGRAMAAMRRHLEGLDLGSI